jgi:sugar fermentation stimulation protein A
MLQTAVFLSRPNRFLARCRLDGEEIICHVKNTGRLRELLVPGREVLVQFRPEEGRKTRWTLLFVRLGETLVSIDSQLPNQIAADGIRTGEIRLPGYENPDLLRREQRFGDSRFDLLLEKDGRRAFVEVKGVTLVRDGCAQFPDAPTERGIRHLRELAAAKAAGYDAFVLFIVQREDAERFSPNPDRPEFVRALREAGQAGVGIYAYRCRVRPEEVKAGQELPVSTE